MLKRSRLRALRSSRGRPLHSLIARQVVARAKGTPRRIGGGRRLGMGRRHAAAPLELEHGARPKMERKGYFGRRLCGPIPAGYQRSRRRVEMVRDALRYQSRRHLPRRAAGPAAATTPPPTAAPPTTTSPAAKAQAAPGAAPAATPPVAAAAVAVAAGAVPAAAAAGGGTRGALPDGGRRGRAGRRRGKALYIYINTYVCVYIYIYIYIYIYMPPRPVAVREVLYPMAAVGDAPGNAEVSLYIYI